ncbi:uncharacterized protein BO97DRAFT_26286 [Aspergillus homomorphus CBS 101889]|uniref:Uncharacterized protein n=1 Tax=Aspergillus homomorphus (strain CBS 101889) TaxID=1450537 RepID=A0A395I164_ASPHC|nr:hypothetical protein BO97DRAFT_26286 [Aspergillus homomorphus CBS 101889]RAL13800.1 hypothetical protein BO97DRAFT_26286 [Aspergillus homomorphus CBS 101889]
MDQSLWFNSGTLEVLAVLLRNMFCARWRGWNATIGCVPFNLLLRGRGGEGAHLLILWLSAIVNLLPPLKNPSIFSNSFLEVFPFLIDRVHRAGCIITTSHSLQIVSRCHFPKNYQIQKWKKHGKSSLRKGTSSQSPQRSVRWGRLS